MTPVIKKNITNHCVQEFETIESNLDTFQDYLISDSTSGKYYSCYSLNRRIVSSCFVLKKKNR